MMTKRVREQRREHLIGIMQYRELSRADVAEMLHVSTDTVVAWLKPETSKSSNPTPQWALELLDYKIGDKKRG